jgi:hypothetical protein
MSKSRLVSGRVPIISGSFLSPDRRQFLSLDQAEPNLGVPVTGSLVASLTDGTRYFISGGVDKTLLAFSNQTQTWQSIQYVNWDQINPQIGEVQLSGSINLSGSFFLNNTDLLQQIQQSGIFQQTGSFWATTNNLQVTGSFKVQLPENETYEISTQEEKRFQINQEGVLVLSPFTDAPTPISGGIFYSGSSEFFLGL